MHLLDLLRKFKENYLSDIRFWILLFFVVRLYGITDPPLEIAHNWRQVTGNMVARNFYEIDNNILYPRLDMAGEKSGITGTEFSVLNYLVYILSTLFGFHDWFGRLINLVVSSIGVLYFYKLLRIKFDEKFSFAAAFVLLTSMWFMYSRKAMPDTFSTSLVLIGLYHMLRYFEERKIINALCYMLFVCVGILSKIPAVYLMISLLIPLFDNKILLKHKLLIAGIAVVILLPVVLWYFYWVPYLVNQFGFWHYYMGTSFANGFRQIGANLMPLFEKFYFDPFKIIGFAVFLMGLMVAIYKKEKKLPLIGGLCSLAFAVIVLKAGFNFCHHSYYVIPFVPIMTLFVAYAVSSFKKNWVYVFLLSAISVESIANQQHDFRIKESERYKLFLEEVANQVIDKKDLIAINGGDNPQLIYFTHRKGWSIKNEMVTDSIFMNDIIQKGCRYLILDKHFYEKKFMTTNKNWNSVFENEHFSVFALKK